MDFEPACRYESARHDVTAFDCGSQAQTRWLRESARMAQAARTATVYVVTPVGDGRVVGYHAVAASSCAQDDAPVRLRKGAGQGPIPVILLARLGVDRSAQGQGLGAALVKDALLRVQEAASVIGARALLIHAESPEAKRFYLHLAEFDASPTDPLHLILLMKDIERITGQAIMAKRAEPLDRDGSAR